MLAAINYEGADHVPLYCWTFGFQAPPHLCRQRNGCDVPYWYSMRLEHIHTLPKPWENAAAMIEAWRQMGSRIHTRASGSRDSKEEGVGVGAGRMLTETAKPMAMLSTTSALMI